jgi:hypothetical protein
MDFAPWVSELISYELGVFFMVLVVFSNFSYFSYHYHFFTRVCEGHPFSCLVVHCD